MRLEDLHINFYILVIWFYLNQALIQCANCPFNDQCKPRMKKEVAALTVSKNASERARYQRYMGTEEYKNYARLRNGIETVPSNLRQNYRLNKLPRGKRRGEFFFGSKVAALNFRKLFNYRKAWVTMPKIQ